MPKINESRLINDESQIIPWCASLIVQDEEEQLVHFAHHSVKEYLLSGSNKGPHPWFFFQLRQADDELAESCVTYLHYDVFQRQPVKVPRLQVQFSPLTPKSIVRTSFSAFKSPIVYRSWLKLEKFLDDRSTDKADVWGRLYSLREGLGTGFIQNLAAHHKFLAYASEHWLFHSCNSRPGYRLWSLWERLVLTDNTVAARPWTIKQWFNGDISIIQYILENNHWPLATLFQKRGGSVLARQRDTLTTDSAAHTKTAHPKTERLPTIVRQNESPILSALDDAIEMADYGKISDLIRRLLSARALAELIYGPFKLENVKLSQPTPTPTNFDNGILTETSNATAQNRHLTYSRDVLVSKKQYDKTLDLHKQGFSESDILFNAVKYGHLYLLHEVLLSRAVDFSEEMRQALRLAVDYRQLEVLKYLLEGFRT